MVDKGPALTPGEGLTDPLVDPTGENAVGTFMTHESLDQMTPESRVAVKSVLGAAGKQLRERREEK